LIKVAAAPTVSQSHDRAAVGRAAHRAEILADRHLGDDVIRLRVKKDDPQQLGERHPLRIDFLERTHLAAPMSPDRALIAPSS